MAEKLQGVEYTSTGAKREYITDDDTLIEHTTFDPTPVVNEAQFLSEQSFDKRATGKLVAVLPLELIALWRSQGFDWFTASEAERKRRLNDPENAIFRVWKGKV